MPFTAAEYANPENEAWLDFRTDADGAGTATATVAWRPRPGEVGSVVIHAKPTATQDGEAGMAGDRLACVNTRL